MPNRSVSIPKIHRQPLPDILPTDEAIRSWGQNEHFYHPDMWELEYARYRYLQGMTDEALNERYHRLVRCMCSYLSLERAVVPILSCQSCWYWFRKEHQTRLEFEIREIVPPKVSISPNKEPFWPSSSPVPNGTDVIFRYGKRIHMREMVDGGLIRFSPAQAFNEEENNVARRDEELSKHAYRSGKNVTVTTPAGKTLPVIGDIRYSTTGPDYHLVCFSCVWDEQLFAAFDADTCVVVTQPEELARRIENAGTAVFPDWYFHHNPVQYFDPYELRKDEYFEPAMSKDFQFAYQNEYRFLWSQFCAAAVQGYQFVKIGASQDIMSMYDIDGKLVE